MKEGVVKAVIIGIAIIIAGAVHGYIGKDVGRYQVSRVQTGSLLRIDTISGELYLLDGQLYGTKPQKK